MIDDWYDMTILAILIPQLILNLLWAKSTELGPPSVFITNMGILKSLTICGDLPQLEGQNILSIKRV